MNAILQAFGKLICGMKRKHLRGRRVMSSIDGIPVSTNVLRCQRCGATWTRKAKNNVPPKAAD